MHTLQSSLGLSLTYDIIKAHGGEIKVNTKEGEGSEFVIQLPIAWRWEWYFWNVRDLNVCLINS